MRVAPALGALFVGTVLALAGTETFFRLAHRIVPPRVPVVDGRWIDDFRVTKDGTPVWKERERALSRCQDRRPSARRLAFFGSSITYGVSLEREQTVSQLLEARLQDEGLDVCSDDFAQPGFSTEQSHVIATEELGAERAALVVLEIWDPARHFTAVGQYAYDSRGRAVDAAGVPALPFVPAVVADPLFRVSAAYRYAALALIPRASQFDESGAFTHLCESILPDFQRLASAGGGHLVALKASPLDAPFTSPHPTPAEDMLAKCAVALGIPVFSIATLLRDQPVEEVRLDPCCHLNAHGHELLAERLDPSIRGELTR